MAQTAFFKAILKLFIVEMTQEDAAYRANITEQDEQMFCRAREESFQVGVCCMLACLRLG